MNSRDETIQQIRDELADSQSQNAQCYNEVG